MKKILVGVDGSPESRAAAAKAAELAQALGARLVIVYVVPTQMPLAADDYARVAEKWDLAERSYAAALLREIEVACRRNGLSIETITGSGPAAAGLADMASAGDVGMVVVGHRGRGAVRRLLVGSVADRLVQICPKPVLVVR